MGSALMSLQSSARRQRGQFVSRVAHIFSLVIMAASRLLYRRKRKVGRIVWMVIGEPRYQVAPPDRPEIRYLIYEHSWRSWDISWKRTCNPDKHYLEFNHNSNCNHH